MAVHGVAKVRPPHLSWGPIGLVVAGGAAGAASRVALSLVIPTLGPVPIAIAIVNVIGAFLLGYLYETVTRLDPDGHRRKNLTLLLGTGFCGGFTTYSSLATDTVVLAAEGHNGLAVLYAAGTLTVGAFATLAGIAISIRINQKRTPA